MQRKWQSYVKHINLVSVDTSKKLNNASYNDAVYQLYAAK